MNTCEYPLPTAVPLPRSAVLDHCCHKNGRKCWWYENGICYADEPGNHRYPHVAGRTRMRGILQASLPEEQIDSDILRKCDEYGWRRAPWYTVTQGCCHPCFARCNDVEPMAECSTDTVTIWKVGVELYEFEYETDEE